MEWQQRWRTRWRRPRPTRGRSRMRRCVPHRLLLPTLKPHLHRSLTLRLNTRRKGSRRKQCRRRQERSCLCHRRRRSHQRRKNGRWLLIHSRGGRLLHHRHLRCRELSLQSGSQSRLQRRQPMRRLSPLQVDQSGRFTRSTISMKWSQTSFPTDRSTL